MIVFATGHITPVNTNISTDLIEFHSDFEDGSRFTYKLFILQSKIFVHFTTESYIDPPSLRNDLFTVVGNLVNAIGFQMVLGLSYEIETINYLDSQETFVPGVQGFVFDDPTEFGEKLTFPKEIADGLPLKHYHIMDYYICRSNFELRNSIKYPDFTALHCRLAIEAVRNAFDNENENQGWRLLREALNIDRAAIDSFRDAANDQRHGREHPQLWPQRRRCMQIAWEICHRYGVWLGQAEPRAPLCGTRYPTL